MQLLQARLPIIRDLFDDDSFSPPLRSESNYTYSHKIENNQKQNIEKQNLTTNNYMMKYLLPIALTISTVSASWNNQCGTGNSSWSCNQQTHQTGGDGEFYSCTNNYATTGYCSSGKDNHCHAYNHEYTDMYCTDVKEQNPIFDNYNLGLRPFTPTSQDTPYAIGSGGWICGGSGALLECPSPTVMVGACGVGKSSNCKAQCPSPSASAILCAMPQMELLNGNRTDVMVIGAGKWQGRSGDGNYNHCPSNQFACGVCQSDNNDDCFGSTWRLKCCDVAAPSNIAGWVAITEIVAPTTITLAVGSTYSDTTTVSQTQSHSWSGSFNIGGVKVPNPKANENEKQATNDMERPPMNEPLDLDEMGEDAGYLGDIEEGIEIGELLGEVAARRRRKLSAEIPGGDNGGAIGGSYEQTESVSQTTSRTVSQSFSYSLSYNYDQTDVGKVLWQWQWSMDSNLGVKLDSSTNVLALTDSIVDQPKCFPNHNWGSNVEKGADYSSCEPGWYLPGYGNAINGRWEQASSSTLVWGTDKHGEANAESYAWSNSIHSSISSGLKLQGPDDKSIDAAYIPVTYHNQTATLSELMAAAYYPAYNANITTPINATINDPEYTWQWVLDITDQYGNNYTTYTPTFIEINTTVVPPKCIPHGNLDAAYQICKEGAHLQYEEKKNSDDDDQASPAGSTPNRRLRGGPRFIF
jgi:hypothetical protein